MCKGMEAFEKAFEERVYNYFESICDRIGRGWSCWFCCVFGYGFFGFELVRKFYKH